MTTYQLKQIAQYATDANIILYTPLLNRYMHQYAICGKLREAAFLGTIIHESGSFRYTRELASGEAYEGRKDLGNTQPGDGKRFAGRGLIQLTGRANYQKASDQLGMAFIDNPGLLELPEYATLSACWWWSMKGLNAVADTGDFRKVTKTVNGGYNGMEDREKWYNKALQVLT